uniref:Uncharacterized protein n=1 Tax=mine drainage metagenome TaxID=410659 RepID=E6PLF2_9ZZZZ
MQRSSSSCSTWAKSGRPQACSGVDRVQVMVSGLGGDGRPLFARRAKIPNGAVCDIRRGRAHAS